MEKVQHKVIFLDRDGVINRDPFDLPYGYVTKWEEFKFLPGAKRAIGKLRKAGYIIYVISNQAGVAKGYFSLRALRRITERMLREVEKSGGEMKEVFYCTHRSEDNCGCRKPKSGLFKKALKNGKINFKDTFFVGDSIRDIEAGKAAGCKTILVLCGKTGLKNRRGWNTEPDYIKRDLLTAVNWILRRKR